ncbi:parB-like partition protein [Alicyclobacillus hesperidum URH17-3-68]|uniref:nucleoid occlusion protein n=1 Tax=Alicyclobacillus hesperidum TaxID=89784 RepID=UPI000281AFF5|nr:nucleoid occlusion protein [Alicyclobacillus hesperidum]EJY56788.1 parB-like partition protein [Alicyclobacillus hesperidum URH17-3-68]KRW91156.1 chromosome partitioning protein ParB [Alicyclobacillus tengchongensis]GLG01856.1 nucleoid occlusion protein [Alicyclobacillus hesperidum subsp. aegles]
MRESWGRFISLRDSGSANAQTQVVDIPVQNIVSNPYQPRTIFNQEAIEELAKTIHTHGVIQPIVVRKKGNVYELIAGERRLRAVRHLGWSTIPAIVRDMNDAQTASAALIENLQREGLTPIEEAVAYQQLLELHGLTQESLAQRLGKGQSTIANKLRLLHLPETVQQALLTKQITERHARALLALPTEEVQIELLNECLEKGWNVKQMEERVKAKLTSLETAGGKRSKTRRRALSKDVRLAVNTIRQSLEMIQQTGLDVVCEESDEEAFYQFTIRVPKSV